MDDETYKTLVAFQALIYGALLTGGAIALGIAHEDWLTLTLAFIGAAAVYFQAFLALNDKPPSVLPLLAYLSMASVTAALIQGVFHVF